MSERSERTMGTAEYRSVMTEPSVGEVESMSERGLGAMCEVA
ncbi:hypothetical protein OHB12_09930 [Nocardia sp. NBC_01730]|nr:hypothetical protein OHB12_09930 [Nocardia sp. NBC_01730]